MFYILLLHTIHEINIYQKQLSVVHAKCKMIFIVKRFSWKIKYKCLFTRQQPTDKKADGFKGKSPVEEKNHHVIITGHSLGGGLARIVGTLTNVPSVSFSPPGLGEFYMQTMFFRHGSLQSIHKSTFTRDFRIYVIVCLYYWLRFM